MAVEIQEPNDLPPNTITDDNANRFEILVYEQSQDVAGIKRLGIAGWKNYLGFNTHKVNNVANYLGIPNEFPWDSPQDETWEDPDLHRYTLTHQVQALADKLGISTEPQTPFPGGTIYPRIQQLETQVQTPTSGLIDKMSSAEGRLDAIESEIGSGTPVPSSLSGRIQELENKVGNEASGSDLATGLIKDVRDLQTTVGDNTSGLVKGVADNTAGISDINNILGDGTTDGLRKTVSTLDTTINDPSDGLVKKVNDLESKVYFYKGNITNVTNSGDTTTEITVDGGTPIQVTVDNLKNGWVYNINPSASGVDSLIINGEKYNRGENVAIINDGSTIKFDKLGANIDVEEVNKIAARYGSQQIAANEELDIINLLQDKSAGIYQLTLSVAVGPLRKISIIVIPYFNDAIAISSEDDIVKLTPTNFSTYWQFNSSTNSLIVKNVANNRVITFNKIGES